VLDNFKHVPRSLERRRRTRNTPVEIIHKLNREINAALGDTNVRSRQHGVSRLSS